MNDDDNNKKDMVSPGNSNRNFHKMLPCKVCERNARFTCYQVRCCEGCRQFFRNVLIGKKAYSCKNDERGVCLAKKDILRCPGCRLNRCLLAGLHSRMMKLPPPTDTTGMRPFLQRLEARRRRLVEQNALEDELAYAQQSEQQIALFNDQFGGTLMSNSDLREWQKINLLLLCERRQKANWDTWSEVPPWIFNIQSPEQLLDFMGNFLTKFDENDLRYKMCGTEKFIDSWETTASATNAICIDALLLMEWLRAMPVFVQLQTEDQLILLKHIHEPFAALLNTFYSKLLNAQTWVRANGHVFCSPEAFGPLWEDEKIRFFSTQYLCSGVEALNGMQMGREEFALLLGIICCTSNIPALSDHARKMLYNEEAELYQILMLYLQREHGLLPGTKRFADCVRLLSLMIHDIPEHFRKFITHRDAFMQTRNVAGVAAECPKALSMFNIFKSLNV